MLFLVLNDSPLACRSSHTSTVPRAKGQGNGWMDAMDGKQENLFSIGLPETSPSITSRINTLGYCLNMALINIPTNLADSSTHSYFPSLSLEVILPTLESLRNDT